MSNTHRSSRLAPLPFAVLGVLLLLGCETTEPSSNRLSMTIDDNGRTVTLRAGEGIDLTLGTVGPGEYSTNPAVSSSAVRLASVSYVGPPTPAGPRQLYRFDAVAPGVATITIPHTYQTATFTLTVEVRGRTRR